jgi:tetratricopeptide (TPR) repeat protein
MGKHRLNEMQETARNYLDRRQFHKALEGYRKLARHLPRVPQVWLDLGSAAFGLRETKVAEEAWRKAQAVAPRDPEVLRSLGFLYQGTRRLDRARACFEAAASVNPQCINSRIALAVLLGKHQEIEGARAIIDECLEIDAKDEQTQYLVAWLDRKMGRIDAAESRLRSLLQRSLEHQYVRYAARYELAEILDSTQRYDEAMSCLLEAKSLVAQLADTEILAKQYDQIAEARLARARSLPKNILRRWAKVFPQAVRESIPILAFLGGHPRSGTTLLEQVLGANPALGALDEPTAFDAVFNAVISKAGRVSPQSLNIVRRRYVEELEGELGRTERTVLLDKNPSPTASLPLRLQVFPETRVLVALRDPRDVLLSCFFQNLPLNNVNANFLSFQRLAKHYTDLMEVWLTVREWADLDWVEVRYENFVTNLEQEGRRITNFLGLEWHAQQMRFFETKGLRRVYSPTYHEVTMPVYTHSVARWERYEKYLGPVLPVLRRYCQVFGYA